MVRQGERTKTIWPSRGERLMLTPAAASHAHIASILAHGGEMAKVPPAGIAFLDSSARPSAPFRGGPAEHRHRLANNANLPRQLTIPRPGTTMPFLAPDACAVLGTAPGSRAERCRHTPQREASPDRSSDSGSAERLGVIAYLPHWQSLRGSRAGRRLAISVRRSSHDDGADARRLCSL